jgi:hypothetical protein
MMRPLRARHLDQKGTFFIRWKDMMTLRMSIRMALTSTACLLDGGRQLAVGRVHEAWAWTLKSFSRHPVYAVWRIADEIYMVICQKLRMTSTPRAKEAVRRHAQRPGLRGEAWARPAGINVSRSVMCARLYISLMIRHTHVQNMGGDGS